MSSASTRSRTLPGCSLRKQSVPEGAGAWSGANIACSPAKLSTVWSMSWAPSHSSTANAAPLGSPGQPTSRSGDTVTVSVIPRMSR